MSLPTPYLLLVIFVLYFCNLFLHISIVILSFLLSSSVLLLFLFFSCLLQQMPFSPRCIIRHTPRQIAQFCSSTAACSSPLFRPIASPALRSCSSLLHRHPRITTTNSSTSRLFSNSTLCAARPKRPADDKMAPQLDPFFNKCVFCLCSRQRALASQRGRILQRKRKNNKRE